MPHLGVQDGDVAAVQVVAVEAVLGVGGVSGVVELNRRENGNGRRNTVNNSRTTSDEDIRSEQRKNKDRSLQKHGHGKEQARGKRTTYPGEAQDEVRATNVGKKRTYPKKTNPPGHQPRDPARTQLILFPDVLLSRHDRAHGGESRHENTPPCYPACSRAPPASRSRYGRPIRADRTTSGAHGA